MKKIMILKKLFRDFWNLGKYYSFSYSFYGLLWWICFYLRPPFCYRLSSFAMKKKTAWLDRYLETHYKELLSRFHDETEVVSEPVENPPIWFFWGQGEKTMPPLVQACYQQLKAYNDHVVLVTTENVEQYIHLAPVIYEKVRNGKITWAHFSDIVRNTLLALHGGLWLDSTVWVPGKLPMERLKTYSMFSANSEFKLNSRSTCFWTTLQWSWSGWCLWSSCKHSLLFNFVSTMLQAVAERENATPDYVIIDYFIHYACRHFPSVAAAMERCRSFPCQKKNDLALMMNQKFDEEKYRELIQTDCFFKLSFRSPWRQETPDGVATFFGKILSGPFSVEKNQ